jgi:hypothetical protein
MHIFSGTKYGDLQQIYRNRVGGYCFWKKSPTRHIW